MIHFTKRDHLVPEMVKSSGPGSSLSELVEVAEAVDVAEADKLQKFLKPRIHY